MQPLLETTVSLYHIQFYVLDLIAISWFVASWFGYGYYANHRYRNCANLVSIMEEMRIEWMRAMLRRDNRIVDSTLIGNLLRSISFFASTSIFILLGLVTLLGYQQEGLEMINNLPFSLPTSPLMWDVKIFTLAFMFIYAFFKYTWSLRLYNYACIFVGAAPASNEKKAQHDEIAKRGGRLIANAGRHFNMGLRAYYFGLAALAWFMHPLIFIVVTTLVVHEVYRREFRSHAVNSLAGLDVNHDEGM